MTNVIRHAGATTMTVSLSPGGHVTLRVADDGQGTATLRANISKPGLGLRACRSGSASWAESST